MLGLLALVGTIAIAIAIPTQGENPRAWGTVGCGAVTVWLCARLAVRNHRLLRHYRGDDLPAPLHQAEQEDGSRWAHIHLPAHHHRVRRPQTAAVTSGVRAKDAR